MNEVKWCPDCGDHRPFDHFTSDRRRADGLAFYCREHARTRAQASRLRRLCPPSRRYPVGRRIPPGSKWCPDCDTVKPVTDFPTTTATSSGVHSYCKPCHNVRGKASKDKVGGSRTYHLKRRYGTTAEEADAMLAAQGGLYAVCRTAPAAHVDHDHDTGRVRQLLCSGCNGGLGQFRDDPGVLRAAAGYVERHRAAPVRADGPPDRGRTTPGRRRPPTPAVPGVRHRGAGCAMHDVVRARVAALTASLERPAAG